MEELRVLIADNSPVYRNMFTRAVTETSESPSVTTVADCDEALELIKRNDYDMIIVDAELPGIGLLELLNGIMLEISKVFILVTGRPSRANEKLFSDTLSNGTVTCMTKPIYDSYEENLDVIKSKIEDIIISLQKNTGNIKKSPEAEPEPAGISRRMKDFVPELVLIAASTGGPKALKAILSELRGDFQVPILVVQHIPAYFTEILARDLNLKSGLRVKVAEDGEVMTAGTVYFAPGAVHMKVNINYIRLEGSPPVNGVRPSADTLFKSVAECFAGNKVLAVILTGMGRDGQEGVASLKKDKDCYCLIQSEKTCVVYGMPRAVADTGLADEIVDLDIIAHEIERFF